MTIGKDDIGDPEMPAIDGSEIEGVIDSSNVGSDGIFRPVLVNQDGSDYFQLTVEDAKRLLEFLDAAIPHLENEMKAIRQ
jgi:hypothetical protein